MTLILAGIAFTISLGTSLLLSKPGIAYTVMDVPGERSLHDRPISRTGGIAILAALAITGPVAYAFSAPIEGITVLVAGTLLVAAVSLWDDRAGVPIYVRLPIHVAAAALVLAGGFDADAIPLATFFEIPTGILSTVLALLYVVWFTNLYNFMDGMDGFAAGMGGIGFMLLAYFGWRSGQMEFGLSAILVASANLGFLIVNFPPARLFLGDVGAIPMGFLAAAFSLWGVRDGVFPLWVPILIFSPFIADATVTLLRRVASGEQFWKPHRSHYYQRLVLAGYGHKKTVLGEYVLMIATGGTAVLIDFVNDSRAVVVGFVTWVLIYLGLVLFVRWAESSKGMPRQ